MAITPEKAGTSQQNATNVSTVHNYIDSLTIDGAESVIIGSIITGSPAESSRQNQPPSVSIDEFDLTRLKKYYLANLCQAVPLPWHPDRAWSIHEIYTELSLHDSEKRKFGVDELFDHAKERFPEDDINRILIEGDAGYGKSTLVLKIISDWSKSDSNVPANYTSPYILLLAVRLSSVGEDENIRSYMERIYTTEIKNMNRRLRDVLESEGATKVLILLDGYDEANAKTQKEVRQIMEKEMLSQCHVVLTSRFGYVPDDIKCKALLVKVHGFGRKQVAEAVAKFFIKAGHVTKADAISCVKELSTLNKVPLLLGKPCADHKPDDLLSIDDLKNVQDVTKPLSAEERLSRLEQFSQFLPKVLDESPHKELAQSPLLCVMLCCLASDSLNSELPSTIPGLYFAMINRNLYRAARKKAKADGEKEFKWNLKALESRIHENHEKYLQEFGRLCVNGLKNRSLSFTLFDITGNEIEAEPTDVKVTQLIEAGVLIRDFTESNTKEHYYQVPHRTMAEFLAAYYLSTETNQTYWFRLFGFAEGKDSLQHDTLKVIWLKDVYNAAATFVVESEKKLDKSRKLKFLIYCYVQLWMRITTFCTVTELGAAGTWSELKMLPNKLQTGIKIVQMKFNDDAYFVNAIITSSEPSLILLQMVEKLFSKDADQHSIAKDFSVPHHVKINQNLEKTYLNHRPMFPKFDLTLNFWEFEVEDSIRGDETNSQLEFFRNLTAVSNSCYVVLLSFANAPDVIFFLGPQHNNVGWKTWTRLGIVLFKVLLECCLCNWHYTFIVIGLLSCLLYYFFT